MVIPNVKYGSESEDWCVLDIQLGSEHGRRNLARLLENARGDQTLAVLGKTGQKGMGEKSIDMTIRCRLNAARTGGVVVRVCWPLSTHREETQR
jgi:hypothetical protein